MKTIWLFILLTGAITQLKAQQAITPPLNQVTLDTTSYPYFRIKPNESNILKSKPVEPKSSELVLLHHKNVVAVQPADHMPIVKLPSTDRMPVVKTDKPNTHYTMLVTPYRKPDSVKRTLQS